MEERQLYLYFNRWIIEVKQMTLTWVRREKIKTKNESLWITTQYYVIKTDYVLIKIDSTQKDSKCKLCGDRDKTVNHIISERKMLMKKKFKGSNKWVGKNIHCGFIGIKTWTCLQIV